MGLIAINMALMLALLRARNPQSQISNLKFLGARTPSSAPQSHSLIPHSAFRIPHWIQSAILLALSLFATFLTDYNLAVYSIFCMAVLFAAFMIFRIFNEPRGWKNFAHENLPAILLAGAIFSFFFCVWLSLAHLNDARLWGDDAQPAPAYQFNADLAFFLIPHPGFSAGAVSWEAASGFSPI